MVLAAGPTLVAIDRRLQPGIANGGGTVLVAAHVLEELATHAEIDSGKPAAGSPRATPSVTPAQVPAMLARRVSPRRDVNVSARFKVGEQVRARNINPPGHTRLPRYARGRIGSVTCDRGVFVFPDTNAHFLGEMPQHPYSIRFTARELWGEPASPRDFVYLDM